MRLVTEGLDLAGCTKTKSGKHKHIWEAACAHAEKDAETRYAQLIKEAAAERKKTDGKK